MGTARALPSKAVLEAGKHSKSDRVGHGHGRLAVALERV